MIKFAHIATVNTTEEAISHSAFHMVLAHIAESNAKYAGMFRGAVGTVLLDNGAFENGVPYDAERMVRIGMDVQADILVLPDYPYKDWTVGWETVEQDIEDYISAGFMTMFVPQSTKGDRDGFVKSIQRALGHPNIDFIGLSILGCPNAGVTRAEILKMFNTPENVKRFHILGMLDTVDEIKDIVPYQHLVNSWDSSAAIWYGLHHLSVKNRKSKFKVPVDFDRAAEWNSTISENIKYIGGLINGR